MRQPPSESRSPLASAAEWVSKITTVALLMVLPGLGGYWLDQQFGTRILFTCLGFVFGLSAGIWHLLNITRSDGNQRKPPEDRDAKR